MGPIIYFANKCHIHSMLSLTVLYRFVGSFQQRKEDLPKGLLCILENEMKFQKLLIFDAPKEWFLNFFVQVQ